MENKTRPFCDIKDLANFSKLAKLLQSTPVKQIFPNQIPQVGPLI
jgi:hypothetical protein